MAMTWGLCRAWPNYYRSRLLRLASDCGISRPGFILSFDCDTDHDSAVVEKLHFRLRRLGLHPIYAVPAEVLRSALPAYKALAEDGAEFLNHGFRRHAARTESGTAISTFSYDPTRPEEWEQDIRRGHHAVVEALGQVPRGFRTPHFGSFEARAALDRLWRFLAGMGYLYSSSTRPLFAAKHGPAFRRHGVTEIPVSGCLDQPAQILDSWGLLSNGAGGSSRLIAQLDAYRAIMQTDAPVLLNIYLDPADVAEEEQVIAALGRMAPYETEGGFNRLVIPAAGHTTL